MSFLAVAMASGGADLSDEQSPAVGPTTIYAFLLVGGLYNLVLTGDAPTRAAGLVVYLFTVAAYWRDGVARAEICFDAEAIRAPRLRVADGATLALIAALAGRGLATAAGTARGAALAVVLALGLAFRLLLAAIGLQLLRRAGRALVSARAGAGRLAGVVVAAAALGWALSHLTGPIARPGQRRDGSARWPVRWPTRSSGGALYRDPSSARWRRGRCARPSARDGWPAPPPSGSRPLRWCWAGPPRDRRWPSR